MPKNQVSKTEKTEVSKKRELTGKVVSDKMKDTVVVLVERFVKVPKYKKYITRTKRHKAHNPGNTKKIGDKVTIRECRPLSKDKHFIVVETQN